jgi:hypothetical protein
MIYLPSIVSGLELFSSRHILCVFSRLEQIIKVMKLYLSSRLCPVSSTYLFFLPLPSVSVRFRSTCLWAFYMNLSRLWLLSRVYLPTSPLSLIDVKLVSVSLSSAISVFLPVILLL